MPRRRNKTIQRRWTPMASDFHGEKVKRDMVDDQLEALQDNNTSIEEVIDRLSSAVAPSAYACAILALAPEAASFTAAPRFADKIRSWILSKATHIKDSCWEIPELLTAYRSVYKLDESGMLDTELPPNISVDKASLAPFPGYIDATDEKLLSVGHGNAGLDWVMGCDDENRRRLLTGEGFRSRIMPLFDDDGFVAHDVRVRHLDAEERMHARIERKCEHALPERVVGAPVFVHSLEAFRRNLAHFSQGLLRNIELGKDRLVLGGSATMMCAMPSLPACLHEYLKSRLGRSLAEHVCSFVDDIPPWLDATSGAFGGSDLDLFVVAQDMEEAQQRFTEVALQLYQNMCGSSRWMRESWSSESNRDESNVLIAQTGHTVTFCGRYPLRHVQLVAYAVKSIDELLAFVDLDCTAMAYDGSNVWVTPRALRGHATSFNVIPPVWMRHVDPAGCSHTTARTLKYSGRGFGTIMYHRCHSETLRAMTAREGTEKLLSAVQRLQEAKPEAIALVKDSMEFRRYGPGLKAASRGKGSKTSKGKNPAQDFYGSASLFPGVPRGPNIDPQQLARMLSRQRSIIPRGPAEQQAPEQLRMKDLKAEEIVSWRIDKCSGIVLDPLAYL